MVKPRSRRLVKQDKQEEDFLAQFGQGDTVKSPKARKMLETMQENDAAKVSDVHDDPVFSSGADNERILLEYMQPQPDNSRYLPVEYSKRGIEAKLEELTGCVVCEKGILENRLSKDDPRYQDVEEEMVAILSLSDSIKEVGLLHPITVWRANTTNYPIITGHRRYYALRYLYGTNVKVKTKVHYEKPDKVSLRRHVENFQRKGLQPADALDDFMKAFGDIETEIEGLTGEERNKAVCKKLACSDGTRFRYEKMASYSDQVIKLFIRKLFTSQVKMTQFLVACEEQANGDTEKVTGHLENILKTGKVVPLEHTKRAVGRTKKYLSFPQLKVENTKSVKRLLQEDVTKLDIGVDWESIDYDDPKELEIILKRLFDFLSR